MYKHMIWDFDGTLFDTYKVMATAAQKTFQEDGIEEPLEEIIRLMKISMTYAFDHYEKKYRIDQSFTQRYQSRRRAMEIEACKPYPGIAEICRYIQESGRFNYINTHRGESTIKLLKDNNLDLYFTDCITSQHGFERKPSPDAINHLIEKYQIKREEAIMIGDRDLDVLSGKNAGAHSCYFDDQGSKSEFADYSISDFQQLYKIID